ncbi:MAG: RibD family protein [Alphaproteobacteria bacterium]|nr:RibD family protein [Alphaproteobacteria bacterium]TAD87272.1 MAG: RibD family protein [Alphaproteobacteria bacterium]
MDGPPLLIDAAPVPSPLGRLATSRPGDHIIVGQLGQTLDGRIATVSGDSKWINGSDALDHLHRLRAAVDAVVVGVGTVLADDPMLTVRRVPCPVVPPARVVIDPRGRLGADCRCLSPCDGARCLVIRCVDAPAPPGAEVVLLPASSGQIDPAALVAALAARGLTRLLIEGGATTLSHFMDAGLVDDLHLLVAPMLLGSGKPGLTLSPVARVADALRPVTTLHPFADGDVLFVCALPRRTAEGS